MVVQTHSSKHKEKVTLMLHSNDKIIKHKVGLLNLAEELGNVSKACQIMGLSRDTFYRYRDAVEDRGVEALLERPRRAPNLKNRVDLETERPPLSRTPLSIRPMARSGSPTNCANRASSFRPPAYARSGCATTWPTSNSA